MTEIHLVSDTDLGWNSIVAAYYSDEEASKHAKARGDSCVVLFTKIYDKYDEDDH